MANLTSILKALYGYIFIDKIQFQRPAPPKILNYFLTFFYQSFKPKNLVRAQASSTVPPPFFQLVKEVAGNPIRLRNFYEGCGTTVSRAMSIGITKMAVYNEVKDFLKRTPNNRDDRYRASNWQAFVPFLHSWKDSDYKKQGHRHGIQ
jgi:hypothetical protein